MFAPNNDSLKLKYEIIINKLRQKKKTNLLPSTIYNNIRTKKFKTNVINVNNDD
jgi:hypothetical protein